MISKKEAILHAKGSRNNHEVNHEYFVLPDLRPKFPNAKCTGPFLVLFTHHRCLQDIHQLPAIGVLNVCILHNVVGREMLRAMVFFR